MLNAPVQLDQSQDSHATRPRDSVSVSHAMTSLLSPEWTGTLGQILQRTGALSKLNEIQQVDLFFVNNVHGISLTEVTATASSTGWEGRWNFRATRPSVESNCPALLQLFIFNGAVSEYQIFVP